MVEDSDAVHEEFLPKSRREWRILILCLPTAAAIALVLWLTEGWLAWTGISVVLMVALLLEARPFTRNARSGRAGDVHAQFRGRAGTVGSGTAGCCRVVLDDVSWTVRSMDGSPLKAGEIVYVHGGSGLELLVSRTPPAD